MKVNETHIVGKSISGMFVGIYPSAYFEHGAVQRLKCIERATRIESHMLYK
jgi:hypothetical protein